MNGILYVVATPLGHLDDLSPRARETLRSAAVIACEDTRRTQRLLARFGIQTPARSYHRFNERERLEGLLDLLRRGRDVALVCDGGTPSISDPGALLVAAARDIGIRVVPVPGPSAAIALLSVSGLSADRFVFEGFLPHREGERRRRLRELAGETRTVVVFEAPHRIRESLRDVATVLGPRRLVLGRELTKIHETLLAGTADDVLAALPEGPVAGEIVIAIAGAPPSGAPAADDEEAGRLIAAWTRAVEEARGDHRLALRRAARELDLGRAELRRRLVEIGAI